MRAESSRQMPNTDSGATGVRKHPSQGSDRAYCFQLVVRGSRERVKDNTRALSMTAAMLLKLGGREGAATVLFFYFNSFKTQECKFIDT